MSVFLWLLNEHAEGESFFCSPTVNRHYLMPLSLAVFPRGLSISHRHSPQISVTPVGSASTWWRGSVPKASTSTGSAFAARPAIRHWARARMCMTLNRVCIALKSRGGWRFKGCQRFYWNGKYVFAFTGKLYCKAHFVQHKNGTHLRRNINGRTVSCFLYTIMCYYSTMIFLLGFYAQKKSKKHKAVTGMQQTTINSDVIFFPLPVPSSGFLRPPGLCWAHIL